MLAKAGIIGISRVSTCANRTRGSEWPLSIIFQREEEGES